MPPQMKKSLLSQYGPAGDLAAQIAADTSLPMAGFQDPPPGIRNGIAQLDEVKFDVYKTGENEGKTYFTASAVILEPLTHTYIPTSQGKPIGEPTVVETAGMVTRIQPVTIANTTTKSGKNMGKVTPWQEHAKTAAQHMRGLGADTSKVKVLSDLETIAESLTRVARNPDTPIYIRFDTSVRQAMNAGDTDGVWQNWRGTAGLENYPGNSATLLNGQVQDTSVEVTTEANGGAGDEGGVEGDANLTETNLDELLGLATDGNLNAQDELLRRAAEATGQTPEEINDSAESWEEIVQMVRDNTSAEAPAPPKKGDHVNFFPMVKGLKGKMSKAKKAVECVVTSVNASTETVTLKNTVDGKTMYKDVPWSDLDEII